MLPDCEGHFLLRGLVQCAALTARKRLKQVGLPRYELPGSVCDG